MTENPEASVLTATRAAQHFRLFRANDAYEHLCILTLLPSLAPLHLMLADTPWPHSFGATLTNVGPLSEGFERSVASPLQPRRLRAMGRTVRSISSLSDNHSNSFQVAVRFARHPDRLTTIRPGMRPLYSWRTRRVTISARNYSSDRNPSHPRADMVFRWTRICFYHFPKSPTLPMAIPSQGHRFPTYRYPSRATESRLGQ